MVGLINNWVAQAEQLVPGRTEPQWLQAKRQAAIQQLKTLVDPSRKSELWRYADAGRLAAEVAAVNAEPLETTTSAVQIVLDEQGYQVLGEQPDWLQVSPLSAMPEAQWQELPFAQEQVVNLANTALFESGVLLRVKDSDQAAAIELIYQFSNSHGWQYVRNHIELAAGTQLQLTERHAAGRINAVNVYQLAAGGQLQRAQQVQLGQRDQFISYNQFELAQGVEVTSMNRHSGGSLQHHQHVVNFNAEQAKYTAGSINKSFAQGHISDIVLVNHHQQHNQSEVTHRSIASDQSQIFNNAKAMVAVGADQSEIEQDLKNILLSADAKIFSKPELEVYADEVVAAHGSTIGALDEQSLFYLQSRGIDLAQSRSIMIESFEQEAVVC